MKKRAAATLVEILLLTCLYIGAGKLGLSLAFYNASASPVWPPAGLALAAILLRGPRVWPAILVGAFLVNVTTFAEFTPRVFLSSVAIAVGNTLEALLAAFLAQRLARGAAAFDRAPDVIRFAFLAALPGTALSTFIGVLALATAGFVHWDSIVPVGLTWWVGDFVSDLIVAPLLVVWVRTHRIRWSWSRASEALAALAFLAGSAFMVFGSWSVSQNRFEAMPYLTTPSLLWIAYRFGQRGATLAITALAAMATYGTVRGMGPFAINDVNTSLVLLEVFIGISTLMSLVLASAVAEGKCDQAAKEKALAQEQAARAEAERANRAKDEFLAVLSHELRTPLTPVLLTASLLERDDTLPDRLRNDIATIRQNAELEARLIDDLLDLTRITRGKLNLEMQTVEVHEAAIRSMNICCVGRAQDIVVQLEAGRHHVRGDPARLVQIFWNLLNNAVKFTPAGRKIVLRSANPDEQSIRFAISDEGVGIDSEALPRLFDAFEQGGPQRGRIYGGLGLGLTITKALVEAHGGTVRAHSDGAGKGATLTVDLPAVPAVQDTEAPAYDGDGSAPGRPLRVLVVEDHEATMRVMLRLLKDMGHEIIPARTVQEALQAVSNGQLDLVISDIGLPDASGYDLMKKLRAMGNGIHGIAISGYGMEQDKRLSFEAGFRIHLTKPVNPEKLCRAISEATT